MFVKKKMPVYSFKEFIPVVDPSSFIHSSAVIIGNVIIGKNVYIGPNAVLRGDWGLIQIDDGCNVQENCVIHMFPGTTVHLEENAHVVVPLLAKSGAGSTDQMRRVSFEFVEKVYCFFVMENMQR